MFTVNAILCMHMAFDYAKKLRKYANKPAMQYSGFLQTHTRDDNISLLGQRHSAPNLTGRSATCETGLRASAWPTLRIRA